MAIQTASGRYISFASPFDNTYSVEDFAHGLSNICRFGGHTKTFYSVAQHCVLVSLDNQDVMPFEKLFHDAAEAFMGDMPTPLKALIPQFRTIEDSVMDSIADQFGLQRGFQKAEAVKESDRKLLLAEKRDLMNPSCFDEEIWDMDSVRSVAHEHITPWSPQEAFLKFLERYEQVCLL